MKDLLLENYIKEVMYNLHQEDLYEISLKDLAPQTTLEATLQAGILSILAIFGNELSKKNELPPQPKEQAEVIMDAVEQEALRNPKIKQILDKSNLQSVEDDLAKQLEKESIEDIHRKMSSAKERKIRDWLSDKSGGHEVSYDGHILSRKDYDYFNVLNDDNIAHGREPYTMDQYQDLLATKKKVDAQEKRLEKISQSYFNEETGMLYTDEETGMPVFDHSALGQDDDKNFSKEKFIEDATGIALKLFKIENSDVYPKGSPERFAVYKERQALEKAEGFISHLDENGEWQDGDVMSKEEIARYYKNADQAVKDIVGQHYSDLENYDDEEM
tara:strand:+ start:508 stop:1497 length:990 start_codon:yes stop_codon:yes gene_type:complete